MKEKLETIDAESLMNTPLEQIQFVVNGFISEGLHILAGSPKIGKSWLSLWICLQVAKGEKVWDFETVKSDVLYLCLEDSFARIQNRLFEITDDAPNNLHFAIMSDSIGNGLEAQIENFINGHPKTKLIVIDTLQKIRNTNLTSANPYASDYEEINTLKQIADKHKIAIILVHHLRKTSDTDPLNMISGTSGIAGSADSSFILKKESRTENEAKLICIGRDIEQRVIYLMFNKSKFVWECLTPIEIESKEVDELIITLCDYMKSAIAFTGTATELSERLKAFNNTECNPAVLKKKIVKHIGYIKEKGIRYSDNRTFERREFTLHYDGNDGMTAETSPINLPSLPSQPSATLNVADTNNSVDELSVSS